MPAEHHPISKELSEEPDLPPSKICVLGEVRPFPVRHDPPGPYGPLGELPGPAPHGHRVVRGRGVRRLEHLLLDGKAVAVPPGAKVHPMAWTKKDITAAVFRKSGKL